MKNLWIVFALAGSFTMTPSDVSFAEGIKVYKKNTVRKSGQQHNTALSEASHDIKVSRQQHTVAPSGSGSHGQAASNYLYPANKKEKAGKVVK